MDSNRCIVRPRLDFLEETETESVWYRPYCCRVSLDPGSEGTGIAIWSDENWDEDLYPEIVGNVHARKLGRGSAYPTLDWLGRCNSIAEQVSECFVACRCTHLYMENPHFMPSAGGNAAAAGGSLVKLATFCGMILEQCRILGIQVELLPVREWKGQMSKEQVIRRILKRAPEMEERLHPKTHSYDAIALGLYAKQKLHLGGVTRIE